MSQNVDRFRSFVLFIIKKSQAGGNPRPSDFNIVLERAFMQEIMKRYGNPHDYVPGQPIPRMAWQINQKITDDLRFLLEERTFILVDGVLTLPDGTTVLDINGSIAPEYLHFSSLGYNHILPDDDGNLVQREVDIRPLKDAEFRTATASHLAPPTTRFPICKFTSTSIKVRPKTLQKVELSYLKVPTTPIWAFTTVSNRPVYDAANSVDIDAPADMINDIAMSLLDFLGISIRESSIVQYAKSWKQTGE